MVEAPGTAPGSGISNNRAVYRHSQQADSANIGIICLKWKLLIIFLYSEPIDQNARRCIAQPFDRALFLVILSSLGLLYSELRSVYRSSKQVFCSPELA